jgi:arylsulfatase A-like enzyme
MKAVMLMFDSLNRHMLSPYGCDWTHTPNFQRLAERTVRFNRNYVGSMPCMPARRELHAARPNFLHNNWSPMQPYDDSAIRMLNQAGVHTHLCSDHYHYWEESAGNYHTKYRTWDFYRGQEGDPFIMQVAEPFVPEHENKKGRPQDWINRMHIRDESQWSLVQTIEAGLGHIRRNAEQDRWFLQIECFDPHEPWYVPEKYKDLLRGTPRV